MESGDRLLEMVRSLSRQEKRYFKLFSSFYAKKNAKKCVQLFDVVNSPGVSDANLHHLLTSQFSPKILPRLKNELFTLILDSLVSFRAQHLADKEARTALEYVEVLLEKGLHRQAAKQLDKAKKLALDVENHLLYLQALLWERSLVLSRYDDKLEQQLAEVYSEMEDAALKQQTWQRYARIQDFSVVLWGRYRQQADEETAADLHALFNNPLTETESDAATVRSRIARLHVLGLRALARNRHEEALEYSAELLALYDAHPALQRKHINQYTRYLLQRLTILVELKDEERTLELVEQIKQMDQLPEHLLLVTVLGALSVELTLFINLRRVKRAAATADDIENYLRYQTRSIHPQNYINLCHNCMAFYFLIGENSRALDLLQLILAERRVELRQDIQDCARAFNLVLHYELGNSDILDNLVRATRRYLKIKQRTDSLEHLTLDVIRRLNNAVDAAERQALFRHLNNELDKLAATLKTKPLGFGELQHWALSRIQGRSIKDIYLSGVIEA